MRNFNLVLVTICMGFGQLLTLNAQPLDNAALNKLVQSFKKDDRGPFQAIRWFCADGSVLPPGERCPEPGGIQHALHKDIVYTIARENKIYLGQILAGTPYTEFLDAKNQFSRLKQYQLEQYLQSIDDGWILKRARYYRGAFQAEDEEAWGLEFLKWLISDDQLLLSQYYLIREIGKDLPHKANDKRAGNIRALSKVVSDSLAEFINIRIKIHGLPEASDLNAVKDFRASYQSKMTPTLNNLFDQLENEMTLFFQPVNLKTLLPYANRLPQTSRLVNQITNLSQTPATAPGPNINYSKTCREIVDLMWNIRSDILTFPKPESRLALIDLSNELERILFNMIEFWKPESIIELLQKNHVLAKGLAGAGSLEIWEWSKVEPMLTSVFSQSEIQPDVFIDISNTYRRLVEWGVAMVSAVFYQTVEQYNGFEPLAEGFIDDKIRGSVLLKCGNAADQLADLSASFKNVENHVMQIENQSRIRGINPGFAIGELVVVTGPPEEVPFSSKKIYVFQRPPVNLKPVGGILTVSAGNLISHVQLLSRNLGIPNSIITYENLADLGPYSGQNVFYAVSPNGNVVLKPASDLTLAEKQLVEIKQRSEDKVKVPLEKMVLSDSRLQSLSELRAFDSGKVCGPKAANLAELKYLFPEKVVEGFIVPFGIFRQHMDQTIPGKNQTYWEFLKETFMMAEIYAKRDKPVEEIEAYKVSRLGELYQYIKNIQLIPEFRQNLEQQFISVLGVQMGKLPVFIRSDTNMEDLKDFTGAGLNLTVFNVVDKEKIFQAIRDVWASPYTERSYKWRQKFLLNPENVYPSILILPTVNVEKSGVMITTGVTSGNPDDITIAFNRGAGGAVEGQVAESYLLQSNGNNRLLFPCRTVEYTVLPASGGTSKAVVGFNKPVLSDKELGMLRELVEEIDQIYGDMSNNESNGPWDVELGFMNGQIWLFQIRPYVENKRARTNDYLKSLDNNVKQNRKVMMYQKLDM